MLKVFRNNPCEEAFDDLVKGEPFNRLVTKLFEDIGNRGLGNGNGATLVLSYITSLSVMLCQICCPYNQISH